MSVLAPREVPLGGIRQLLVRRTLPHRDLRTVGAWCFLDDYGPHPVTGGRGMDVPPHPHAGLQTVTWLLDGEVRHQDSLGSDTRVRPGELNLMTAGRGISHAETTPVGADGVLRGLQLWVALPARHRDTTPDFAHHGGLPAFEVDGLSATVLLGSLGGVTSPARAFTPIVGAEVLLAPDTRVALPVDPHFEHAVLALTDVAVEAERVPQASLLHLPPGRGSIRFAGGHDGARLMLLGGEPFGEELLMWWNFVLRSHEEVVEAREEWMAAVAGATTRFGAVAGYPGPALAAPALPTSRLRPRRSR